MPLFTCLLIIAATGCERQYRDPEGALAAATASPPTATHPVEIRSPPVPRGVKTSLTDASGRAVILDCRSCHAVRAANRSTSKAKELIQYHQGMHLAHGTLKCVSCHNAADGYASLHLADGTSLPFSESMTLCAQCHGTQYKSYLQGSHGGMTGHWDLTRGGRVRNHCLHCHDAHVPKFPLVLPVAGPRDRFAPAARGASHD